MATDDRGFGQMSEKEHKKVSSKGGHAQGKENNPANFANDKTKAKRAGKAGGASRSSS
jgi:general stress protein YciG